MKIDDFVYGESEFKESILISLVNSKPLQRLKGISQLGMPNEYYYKKGYSRYAHSLGVAILLKKLGGTLKEQIAGLLHDISHTAFSHVVDWVVGDPTKEDYQDNLYFNFVKNSEIPLILEKYGFYFKDFSKLEKFSLLEKNLPSLCADRIDYTLREFVLDGRKNFVKEVLSNLEVKENQIVFLDKNIAEDFARGYMDLQNNHWGGNQARARYYILSNILKKALKNKIISLNTLMETDQKVISILEEKGDKFILDNLNLLRNGLLVINYEKGIELKKKFRYLDPEVYYGKSILNLSKISKEYGSFLENQKLKSKEIVKVKIFKNEN